MKISIPLDEAQARFPDLAAKAKAGEEAIVTKGRPSLCGAVGAESLAYYHRLERERLDALLIEDAMTGLEEVAAGKTEDAYAMLDRLKQSAAR